MKSAAFWPTRPSGRIFPNTHRPWRVLVAPQPGNLREITAKHPHPDGWIEVDLRFEGGKVYGKVVTPVPGTFAWGGRKIDLSVGGNVIDL